MLHRCPAGIVVVGQGACDRAARFGRQPRSPWGKARPRQAFRAGPRSSPTFPALLGQRIDPRRAGANTWWLAAEQRLRRIAATRPYDAVAEQPRQLAVVVVFRIASHGFAPRDGASATGDEPASQRAQASLGLGDACNVHQGLISPFPQPRTCLRHTKCQISAASVRSGGPFAPAATQCAARQAFDTRDRTQANSTDRGAEYPPFFRNVR
jgi:hypothetical protein